MIDTSIPSDRVVRTLEQIAAWRGYPRALCLDNGPKMISSSLALWCEEHRVELRFIQPGKPNQNACIERFNRTCRNDVLDACVFTDLAQVREITEDWLRSHDEERAHRSPGRVITAMFRERIGRPGARFRAASDQGLTTSCLDANVELAEVRRITAAIETGRTDSK